MTRRAHEMQCLRAALASALLGGATLARAEMIDLAWTPSGTFERKTSVAPGQFAEVCGPLAKGKSVQWRFETGAALDFNIHYHHGKDVIYPARADGAASADGTLAVDLAQDYCWMWTNPSASAVDLKVRLQRR